MITLPDAALLLGAGVIAGVVGTAGGVTSLIAYPALLSVGIPVFPATVSNIVAAAACGPGAAVASRPELQGKGAWLRRRVLVTAAGGAIGAGLLLSTPAAVLTMVAPYLLAFASFGILLQPRFSLWVEARRGRGNRLLVPGGVFAVSTYNGYFGAGAGIMMLSIMLISVDHRVATANALKNMLIGFGTGISAVALIAFGHVDWMAVAPLASGMLIGSMIGPAVARRLPGNLLRWLAALTGLALAARLWVAPI